MGSTAAIGLAYLIYDYRAIFGKTRLFASGRAAVSGASVRQHCHIYLISPFKFFSSGFLEVRDPKLHAFFGNVEALL
jgi:hypothetical protein